MARPDKPLRTCIYCRQAKKEYKNFNTLSVKPPVYDRICKKCVIAARKRYGWKQHKLTLSEQLMYIVNSLKITDKEFNAIIDNKDVPTIANDDIIYIRFLFKELNKTR